MLYNEVLMTGNEKFQLLFLVVGGWILLRCVIRAILALLTLSLGWGGAWQEARWLKKLRQQ